MVYAFLQIGLITTLSFGCGSSAFTGGTGTSGSNASSADSLEGANDGGLSAEGLDGDNGSAGAEIFRVQDTNTPVDIVISIDRSPSMTDESNYLQANVSKFLENLTASKVDAKVIVIATGFTSNQPPEKVQVIPRYIFSNNSIGIVNQVFANNEAALRDKNPMEMVFVTDDNGRPPGNNLAADFRPPTDRKVIVNAIVGLKEGQDANNPDCEIPRVGTEYMKLASTTKGSVFDICLKDWDPLLKKLGDNIVQRARSFVLAYKPVAGTPVMVSINGTAVPADKVTYDADANSVLISADVALKPGDKITVTYQPE